MILMLRKCMCVLLTRSSWVEMIISIPCLYTKQKTKKRKSWNDGTLKINQSSGTCRLFDNLDGRKVSVSMLEAKTLRGDELAIALRGEECEIEFDTYLVTVDAVEITGASSLKSQKVGSPSSQAASRVRPTQVKGLALAPFKPPSKVAPSSSGGGNQFDSEDQDQWNDEAKNGGCSNGSGGSAAIARFKGIAQRPSDFSKRYEGTSTVVVTRAGLEGAAQGGASVTSSVVIGGKYQVDDVELDELRGGEEDEEQTIDPAAEVEGQADVDVDEEYGQGNTGKEQQLLSEGAPAAPATLIDAEWDSESLKFQKPEQKPRQVHKVVALDNRSFFGNDNEGLWDGGGGGLAGKDGENLNPAREGSTESADDMWSF